MTTAESGDNARECLEDVVSHFDSLRAGLCAQRAVSFEASDADCIAYWNHEIAALERMKSQAQAALAVTVPQDGGGECARFEAWFEQNKVHAHGWSPRYAAIEGWQAALAQKAVPVAVAQYQARRKTEYQGASLRWLNIDHDEVEGILSREEMEIRALCVIERDMAHDRIRAVGVPNADWQLVPRVPTDAMNKAGELGWCNGPGGSIPARAAACYSAMLRATPPAPIASAEEEEPRSTGSLAFDYAHAVIAKRLGTGKTCACTPNDAADCEYPDCTRGKTTRPAAAQPVAQTAECSVASDCKWPSCRRDCVIRTDAAAQPSRAEVLTDALARMDLARGILTDGNPRPGCNWGMLDTADLRAKMEDKP